MDGGKFTLVWDGEIMHMDASSKIEVMEHVFPLGRKIIRRKIYPLVQSCFFVMVLS